MGVVRRSVDAELRTGADALQPPLRCGFRARLTASVSPMDKGYGV